MNEKGLISFVWKISSTTDTRNIDITLKWSRLIQFIWLIGVDSRVFIHLNKELLLLSVEILVVPSHSPDLSLA